MNYPAATLTLNPTNYVNYSAIGIIAGHKITHAFDEEGAKYDSFGNQNNRWTEKVQKQYDLLISEMSKVYTRTID